jgi:post-segregation antitoxin (ccd killing protein)
MVQMAMVRIITPKKLSIRVPKQLLEEFLQRVDEKSVSPAITEALTDELKKIQVRRELKKYSNKMGLKAPLKTKRKTVIIEDSPRVQ